MKKQLLITILTLCSFVGMKAQQDSISSLVSSIETIQKHHPKLVFGMDALSFFDNREHHSQYQKAQTLYGIRLSPEIGLEILDSKEHAHRIIASLHYLRWMGGEEKESVFIPSVYYQYQSKHFMMNLGNSPYSDLVKPLPDYLLSDSLSYVSPVIQGALFQYTTQKGYAAFLCDWRGKQSETKREAFRLVGMGEYQWKMLRLGGYFQMNHTANYLPPTPRIGVIDDILVNPYFAIDASEQTDLKTLSLQLGYIFGLERERITERSYKIHAMHVDARLRYKCLSLQNQLYLGDNLFPLYSKYGSTVNLGDPFYQYEWYDRLDMSVYLLENKFMNCLFSWNLHFSHEDIGHQQQLILNFRLP